MKSAAAPNLAGWLRREHEVYASLSGAFIPRLEGWDDDGVRPVLALEDLSDADWQPRWTDARVAAVVDALAEIASSPASAEHALDQSRTPRASSTAGRPSCGSGAVPRNRDP